METDERYTPSKIIGLTREILCGIDLDPCSCPGAQRVVQANRYFTQEDNALDRSWDSDRVFINPPGSLQLAFANKLVEQMPHEFVWLAFNFDHSTRWFRTVFAHSTHLILLTDRWKFSGKDVGRSQALIVRTSFTSALLRDMLSDHGVNGEVV